MHAFGLLSSPCPVTDGVCELCPTEISNSLLFCAHFRVPGFGLRRRSRLSKFVSPGVRCCSDGGNPQLV